MARTSNLGKSKWLWLTAALLLFALATWLMGSEPDAAPPANKRVAFPTHLRPKERARIHRRQIVAPTPPATDAMADDGEDDTPQPTRDPVLRALAADASGLTLFVELNALRHSPLGERFLDCLDERAFGELQTFREKYGVDPLADLDRLGISGDALLLSGKFGDIQWDQLLPNSLEASYGDEGRVFRDELGERCVGIWRNELIFIGDTPESVEAAIDRIEGRAEFSPAVDDGATYGEIYGVVGSKHIAKLLAEEQTGLAEKLRTVVDSVEIHMDAMDDVALNAQFHGGNNDENNELARSLAGALALARISAQTKNEDELAQLLEQAHVSPMGSSFELNLALPQALLDKAFDEMCASMRPASPPDDLDLENENGDFETPTE